MPSSFFIRKAQLRDAAEILALITELAVYEKAPNAVVVSLSEFEMHGWGENPLFTSWVAVTDGQVVGMTLCYVRYSTRKGPVFYLEDFYVKKDSRKQGIGQALFDACVQYAKENNYERITWQVLEWNQLAIDFYNRNNALLDSEWVNGSIILH
jgi:GNAT superfamily N-acetyltransferase